MFASNGSRKIGAAGLILTMIVFSMACVSWAAGFPSVETQTAKRISLQVGKSIVLKSEEPVKRISIADPAVADFVLISPNEIYITGKGAGVTNMTLWLRKGKLQGFRPGCRIRRLPDETAGWRKSFPRKPTCA